MYLSVNVMDLQRKTTQSWNRVRHIPLINRVSSTASTVTSQSIIFHVDMDHFCIVIELREHSEYQGKALVVGANPKKGSGQSVVSTCNYLARKYGITSDMPISQAWRRCPTAILLPPNYQLYRSVSEQNMGIFRAYSRQCDLYGIDEARAKLFLTSASLT